MPGGQHGAGSSKPSSSQQRGGQLDGQGRGPRRTPATRRRCAAPAGTRRGGARPRPPSTSALSAPNGIEPCAGVPCTRSRPTAAPSRRPGDGQAQRRPACRDREAARLGDHVVGSRTASALVLHEVLGAVRPPASSSATASVDERARGPEARRRPGACMATAIDAGQVEHVDGAAAPHQPSMSSPPNGSFSQRSSFTGTTSVWPDEAQRRRVGVAALDARDQARPTGRRRRSARRRGRRPRGSLARRSALRTSSPDSGEPSLTHRLRIICWTSSTTSLIVSD